MEYSMISLLNFLQNTMDDTEFPGVSLNCDLNQKLFLCNRSQMQSGNLIQIGKGESNWERGAEQKI